MKKKHYLTVIFTVVSILTLLLLIGCEDNKTEKTLTPDRDVAETVSGAISYSTGGVIDQVSDLCEFLDVNDTTKVEKVILKNYAPKSVTVNRVYNNETGFWTINVEKIRGDSLSVPYAHIIRRYTLKFVNAQGFAQRNFVTGADTARTVEFNIKSGSGRHVTRRISQQLDSLLASWTVTDAHKPLVTINGTYYRVAVDTITGFNRTRTSDHTLELNFNDIVAPRGMQSNFYSAVSGSLTGSFHADITFLSGAAYSETSVNRTINVTFGSGRGNITLGTKVYKADLYSGELVD